MVLEPTYRRLKNGVIPTKLMNRIFNILLSSFVVISLSLCPQYSQSQESTTSLKSYISCDFQDGLSIVAGNRRISTENYRELKIPSGIQRISVIDGYRLGIAYAGRPYLFANMKVEQSDSQLYEQDKKSIREYLNSLENTIKINLKHNGFTVIGQEMSEIDQGGVMGLYVILSDTDQVIITTYLLNQGKEKRVYSDISEFREIRDSFFESYTKCIKKK